jgi:ketosteroid isomerase-like protein
MPETPSTKPAVAEILARLVAATNAHDVDAVVNCFAADYVNETPAHPMRSFRGREQVRRNWERIFAAVPDLEAEMLASVVDRDTAWTEWEHRGTRLDGGAHLMRGVMIFTAAEGLLTRVRFYFEAVEHTTGDADAAVEGAVGAASNAREEGEP